MRDRKHLAVFDDFPINGERSLATMLGALTKKLESDAPGEAYKRLANGVKLPGMPEGYAPTYGAFLRDALLYFQAGGDDFRMGEICRLATLILLDQPDQPLEEYAKAIRKLCEQFANDLEQSVKLAKAIKKTEAKVKKQKAKETAKKEASPDLDEDDGSPRASWGSKEWSSYFNLPDGYPISEDNVGRLRKSLQGVADDSMSNDDWRMLVARVLAISIGLVTGKGKPLTWPCRGWKRAKLEAEFMARRDELLRAAQLEKALAKKKAEPPAEDTVPNGNGAVPKNEHGDAVFTPKGTARLFADLGEDCPQHGVDW